MTTKISFGDKLYRGEKSFNFVNNRKRWYSLSAILIIASIFALGAKGLELGIEFKGGSEFVLNQSGITVPEARAAPRGVPCVRRVPRRADAQGRRTHQRRARDDRRRELMPNQPKFSMSSLRLLL